MVSPPLAPPLTQLVRRGTGVAIEVTGLDVATLVALLPAMLVAKVEPGGRAG